MKNIDLHSNIATESAKLISIGISANLENKLNKLNLSKDINELPKSKSISGNSNIMQIDEN